MEDTKALLEDANDEVQKSLKTLQDLQNKILNMADPVLDELTKQSKAIQAARMTAVREITQTLTSFRDVRKFFLEKDYEIEIERLERFVELCKELEALKARGVLDAIADVSIRMAIQEEAQIDRKQSQETSG